MQAAKKKTTGLTAKTSEPVKEVVEAKADVAPPPAAGGKGKKLTPALAKLQKQQEEIRRRQEEQARREAEEKARIEEEERREAEEEKRREEAKALKKQKEKEKIEQQKKDGTYLTKAQREEKLKNEMKLKEMVAAGLKVGGEGGAEKKKLDYKKKKGIKKNPDEIKVCFFLFH
jgi:translation initiation factor 5B